MKYEILMEWMRAVIWP